MKFRSFIVLYIHLFFSNIRNIDNYQSIFVKLKFPLKDIYSTIPHCYEKKWDENQSIFNFLLHVTGTSKHFLRTNCLEACYFHVCLHICETQVHSCTWSVISWISHLKFWKRFVTHIFSLFLTTGLNKFNICVHWFLCT